MKLRTTSEYSCQAWTVAILSIAACVLGMGQIAVGIWLFIYSSEFRLVIGIPLHNVYIGYAATGLFAFMCGVQGACAAVMRRKYGLILYIVLLVASVLCQGGVWAFVYLEQREVSDVLSKEIVQHREYHEFIDQEFNCDLGLHNTNSTAANLEAEKCSDFLSSRLWTITWAMLGLCATQICLQFVLIMMAVMLIQLVREALLKARFEATKPDMTLQETDVEMERIRRQKQQEFLQHSQPRPTAGGHTFSPLPPTPDPWYISDEQHHENHHNETANVHRAVIFN